MDDCRHGDYVTRINASSLHRLSNFRCLVSATETSTSSSLLRRVQASDPRAWELFAQLYAPVIYSWARQTGLQAADAADVTQETFRALVSRIGSFRKSSPGDSFRGWLWTITRNKIRDHFRKLAGHPQALGGEQPAVLAHLPATPPDENTGSGASRSEAYLTRQTLQRLQADFEPRTWQAFWEVAIHHRPPGDVADELQMSVGAVYMAKSRVLKRLRQELSDEEA